MLYWLAGIAIWLIGATLGHMYFIPFSMRFSWDRGMTRFFVSIWPAGFPLALAGFIIFYLLSGLEFAYNKTWGRLADQRLAEIEREKERISHQRFMEREAQREAEELARREARKAAQAKNQDEPQPIFREPPKPVKSCKACESTEEHWRKIPNFTIMENDRTHMAELEAEEEESPASFRHIGESTIC